MSHRVSRVFAIDWSGDKRNARRKIWLAEAKDGRLVRFEKGKSREEVADWLINEAEHDGRFIVGLDLAFSFPFWFCQEKLKAETAYDVWVTAEALGEQWLSCYEHPFWGKPGCTRHVGVEGLRQTEKDSANYGGGIKPKSTFQIGGAGAVGTGSIRGMPMLKKLRDAGFSIWPFHHPGWPRVVEIYPRLLTGTVNKSSKEARAAYIEDKFPNVSGNHLKDVVSGEDAFDAAVSALVMANQIKKLATLSQASDPIELIEGRIWSPVVPVADTSN